TGQLFGPLLGGTLADAFGYSSTFQWVSVTIFLSALLVLFGVQEVQYTVIQNNKDYKSYSSKEVIQHIIGHPALFVVLLLSTLIQIAHFSVQPILSLFVAEIHG